MTRFFLTHIRSPQYFWWPDHIPFVVWFRNRISNFPKSFIQQHPSMLKSETYPYLNWIRFAHAQCTLPKGQADGVMMMQEQSLPYLVGLPAEKHPAWSQIFYQQDQKWGRMLNCAPELTASIPQAANVLSDHCWFGAIVQLQQEGRGMGQGNCDWVNKRWHHWHDFGNILEMFH